MGICARGSDRFGCDDGCNDFSNGMDRLMSGLQKIDPVAQRLIVAAIEAKKDLTYIDSDRSFLGREIESVHVQVVNGEPHISQKHYRQPVLGDWLQLVGGVAMAVIGGFLVWNMVRGVFIKSEIGHEVLASFINESRLG